MKKIKISPKAKKIFKAIGKAYLIALMYFVILFALPVNGIYRVLIAFCVWYIRHLYSDRAFRKKNDVIRMWFGVPGSGKTTMAAFITKLRKKKNIPVYSNVEISDNYILDPLADLGVYSMYNGGEGGTVILDEASIDGFDCRDYKTLPETAKKFFALHRHECCEVHVFSQAIDIDKKIRDRAVCCYYLQRSIIPWHVSYRRIKKVITINEEKQMLDGFEFVPFSHHLVFSRPLWKMFDTLDRSLCPTKQKNWIRYGDKEKVNIIDTKEKPFVFNVNEQNI